MRKGDSYRKGMLLDFESQILVEMSLPGGKGIGRRRRRPKLKPTAFAISLSSLGRGENLQGGDQNSDQSSDQSSDQFPIQEA